MQRAKSFTISKQLALEAYRSVKSNRGAAGIDEIGMGQFDENRKVHL